MIMTMIMIIIIIIIMYYLCIGTGMDRNRLNPEIAKEMTFLGS